MRYRIYRHPEVTQDLFDIADFIAEYAGIGVAERKLGQIERSICNLSETPHIGSVRNDLYPGLRAIPVARKGVMTFIVDDKKQAVFIVSIAYARTDWIGKLPQRFAR